MLPLRENSWYKSDRLRPSDGRYAAGEVEGRSSQQLVQQLFYAIDEARGLANEAVWCASSSAHLRPCHIGSEVLLQSLCLLWLFAMA